MARPFSVGEQVEWRYFGGKEWDGGVIASIDLKLGIMTVNQGHRYGFAPDRVSIIVRRIKGRWLAFRPSHDYLDRIRRVKEVDLRTS